MGPIDRHKLLRLFDNHQPHAVAQQIGSLANAMNLLIPQGKEGIPAAVLIPIIDRQDGLNILLTERTKHLSAHPGQISFPGGRLEAVDNNAVDAALRESREEVGLQEISVLGEIGTYSSYSGYDITAILGLVHPPFDFSINTDEVESVIEVPLQVALDLNQYKLENIVRDGERRHFYTFHYEDKPIWGFTGSLLYILASWLKANL